MYTVVVRQRKNSYNEDIVGSFETVGEAVRFCEVVLKAFKKTSVSVMNSEYENDFVSKYSFADITPAVIKAPAVDTKED